MRDDALEMPPALRFDIAFPCYNAARWVDGFFETLLGFGDERWRLITRDDGSSDGTREILKGWQQRLGSRLVLLDADGPSPNLGIIGNYNAVLGATSAPWILTADPDDLWLPNRINSTLRALAAAEAESGADTPIIVSTDAEVVDSDLVPVAPSYWHWTRNRPPARYTVPHAAMDCAVLGSTMAMNRALLQAALPLPAGAAYQDWYMALVAIAFGRLVILPEATIRYVRHGANATKDPFSVTLKSMVAKLMSEPRSARRRLDYLIRQAAQQGRAFAEAHEDRLSANDAHAMRALQSLPALSPLQRRIAVARHGLWFNSTMKNLGLMVLL